MPRKPKQLEECIDGTLRPCLKCQREFCSTGIGNRLCKRCNDDNVRTSKWEQRRATSYTDLGVIYD